MASDLNSGNHPSNTIDKEGILIMPSISGSLTNFNNILSAISKDIPQDSYLVTLNEHATAAKYLNHVIALPGDSISKQSTIGTQAITMIFIEILLSVARREL